ncbi:MAG TPA: cytochrome c biogenesis protein CcsA [Gemmataceae bacterium]|nr:cytochrome c biogenesis protein CcsA [Gemmataceae bacterium]
MTAQSRTIPWIAVSVAALVTLVFALRPPADSADGMHLAEAGRLLVVGGGRFKPLDSYAREQMMYMSKRQDYKDGSGETQPAIRWLLDTMARGLAHYYRRAEFVTITNSEVLKFLELPPREDHLYHYSEFRNKPQLKQETERIFKQIHQKQPASDFDKDLLRAAYQAVQGEHQGKYAQAIRRELAKRQTDRALIFRIENDQVLAILGLPRREGLRYSYTEIIESRGLEQFERKAKEAEKRPDKEWDVVDGKVVELYRQLRPYREAELLLGVLLVPPPRDSHEEEWLTLGHALIQADRLGQDNPNTTAVENLLRAYGMGDVKGFNEALAAYQQELEGRYPNQCVTARQEAFFNHLAPFYLCTLFYVFALVLVCVSWIGWTDVLNRTAFALLVFTFVFHTLALLARMYLQGRPPVTNLYSSAVFIGWGAVGLGLLLERIFKLGVGNLVGASLGFLTTLISHHLAASGDTLEMMQAVLDTNFWLATHVTCITLGYVATLFAGFLAIVYAIRGVLTTTLDRVTAKTLSQMIYGVVCFATLLSFVGTVLGGVWADQSWGRFWGWDPKENGALLIVAMNALILHARWAGMIRDRGMVVLAMVGNMATLWSWFGTNQLGIGLHSYGVNKTLVEVCRYCWILQGLLIGLALLPLKYWRSFQVAGKLPAAPARPSRKPSAPIPASTR